MGWAAIVEWLSLEKVIDLDDKQRTKLKSLLIATNFKNFFRSLGGGGCLGVDIPGLPPPFCMNPCICRTGLLQIPAKILITV